MSAREDAVSAATAAYGDGGYGHAHRMNKAIAAYEAALSAAGWVVEQGWCSDMSKAPRDKMLLLGHVAVDAPIVGYWARGAWRENNGKATVVHPTHWRPLPTPPQEDTEAARGAA